MTLHMSERFESRTRTELVRRENYMMHVEIVPSWHENQSRHSMQISLILPMPASFTQRHLERMSRGFFVLSAEHAARAAGEVRLQKTHHNDFGARRSLMLSH